MKRRRGGRIGPGYLLACVSIFSAIHANAQDLRYYNRVAYTDDTDPMPIGAQGVFGQEQPLLAPNDGSSLAELVVHGKNFGDRIEVGWHVTKGNPRPRLFVFYWSNGLQASDYDVGFMPAAEAHFKPKDLVLEHAFISYGIMYEKSKDRWLISYDGEWIGFFPGELWAGKDGVNRFKGVASTQWFGEVAPRDLLTPSTVGGATKMGNGLPGTNPGSAAIYYLRLYGADGRSVAISPAPEQLVCPTPTTCSPQDYYVVGNVSQSGFHYGGPVSPDGAGELDAGVPGTGGSDGGKPSVDTPPLPSNNRSGVHGDPHFLTWDGLHYDCQVWGETTLCRSENGDLEVQMRTHLLTTKNVAVITAVAARIGDERIAFYLDGTVTENDELATFDARNTPLLKGGAVWNIGGRYVVVWPNENTQLWVTLKGYYINVDLFLADERKNSVFGLLGSFNADWTDDIMPRSGGLPLMSPASFAQFYGPGGYADSWRVTKETSLFTYRDGEDTDSPEITNPNFPTLIQTVQSLTDAERQQAAQACQSAVGVWNDDCVLDVASSGDQHAADGFADLPPPAAKLEVQPPVTSCGGAGAGGGRSAGSGDSAGTAGTGGVATAPCSPGSACTYRSCLDILLSAASSLPDGTYCICPDANQPPFSAYCDMTTDGGGGWTRVAGITASDHSHVTNLAVNAAGLIAADALGKFSDATINALKSGADPAFRLTCQNNGGKQTGYFPATCQFNATPSATTSGSCTTVAYTFMQPETYDNAAGASVEACVVGLADGEHKGANRLIYGANPAGCNNNTTGCDAPGYQWNGNGSLWVR